MRTNRERIYVGAYQAVMVHEWYSPMTLSEVARLKNALDADQRKRRRELQWKRERGKRHGKT